MGAEIGQRIEDKQQLIDNMLKVLPEKAAKNRRKAYSCQGLLY